MLLFTTVKKNEENNTTKRLRRIHEFYKSHSGCTVIEAITFIPETKFMVEKYSSLRSKLTIKGTDEPELTDKLERCEYNKNKL